MLKVANTASKTSAPLMQSGSTSLDESTSIQKVLDLIPTVRDLVFQAGDLIRSYKQNPIDVETKEDGTERTLVDLKIQNEILVPALTKILPGSKVISEEEDQERLLSIVNALEANTYLWIIDPLDGTKVFAGMLKTEDEKKKFGNYFGTTISLVYPNENKELCPIYSVFYAPLFETPEFKKSDIQGIAFEAFSLNEDKFLVNDSLVDHKLSGSQLNSGKEIVIGSIPEADLNLEGLKYTDRTYSSTLRMALLATGVQEAPPLICGEDVALWDLMAGLHFIKIAGGISLDENRNPTLPLQIEKLGNVRKGLCLRGRFFVGSKETVNTFLSRQNHN